MQKLSERMKPYWDIKIICRLEKLEDDSALLKELVQMLGLYGSHYNKSQQAKAAVRKWKEGK